MWSQQRKLVSLLPLGGAAATGAALLGSFSDKRRRQCVASCESNPGSHPTLTCQIETQNGHTVVFRNKENFLQKRAAFMQGGSGGLQVISDFDYTMTQFFVSPGRRGASCHCLIEDCGFLPPTYQAQAKALFHYYYPLEVSSSLTVQEKVPHMQEWVEKAHDLLLLSKLRQSQIKFAVAEALNQETICLRPGVTELLGRLQQEQVPVLLFSAGLADVIEEILKQKCGGMAESEVHPGQHSNSNSSGHNAHIVSNHMVFDKDILVGFSAPSYHVFNKKALYAKDTSPYFAQSGLSQRQNLLLLGDSLGDTTMCEGLDISDNSKIKIGFLNDKVERLPEYLRAYDVVLLGDPDFEFISSLLDDIVTTPAAALVPLKAGEDKKK